MTDELERKDPSLLIISADSPESYSPSGERIRHLAVQSGLIFRGVAILSLKATKRREAARRNGSTVVLYEINFSRAMPFPFSAFFDPIMMLMFLVHGFILYRRIKPSYVLASVPPLEAGLSAWIISRLHGNKSVIDVRDDWESAIDVQLRKYFPKTLIGLLSALAKRTYDSARVMFAVTQTISKTIRKRGITTPVFLVPNGADTRVFKPTDVDVRIKKRSDWALPTDKTIIVYCGSAMNPYYRLDLTLRAIRGLPQNIVQNLLFVFYVYNGFDWLENLKHKLAIPDGAIEVRSPLPRSQLADVLSVCDVGLVPFDAEHYLLCARSTKLYEYLSSGLFVLCSGPKGGELDSFLSANPDLGLFTLPSVSDLVSAFRNVAERTENMYNDFYRKKRHAFIKANYDRRGTMRRAVSLMEEGS